MARPPKRASVLATSLGAAAVEAGPAPVVVFEEEGEVAETRVVNVPVAVVDRLPNELEVTMVGPPVFVTVEFEPPGWEPVAEGKPLPWPAPVPAMLNGNEYWKISFFWSQVITTP